MRLVVAVEGAGPVRNVGGMATGAGVEEDMVVVVGGLKPEIFSFRSALRLGRGAAAAWSPRRCWRGMVVVGWR